MEKKNLTFETKDIMLGILLTIRSLAIFSFFPASFYLFGLTFSYSTINTIG